MLLETFSKLVLIYILIVAPFRTNGEVFSAVADMEDVFKIEELHIKSLEQFVSDQEKLITVMKTYYALKLFQKRSEFVKNYFKNSGR